MFLSSLGLCPAKFLTKRLRCCPTTPSLGAFLPRRGGPRVPCPLLRLLPKPALGFASLLLFLVSLQPTKVLGIYTFTKRVALEEMENKARKQQGYSTVSHFNIVHYDCHLAAVR